jgi:hypothetical protein
MNKTVSSVIDDINEWENPRGGFVYYVTAMFTDESVGSVGKKTKADAELVKRQLQDAIGEPLEFTVEDGGISQGGRQKWKIRDFGPPGVQGGDSSKPVGGSANAARSRSPEPSSEQASIRVSVALKAAVKAAGYGPLGVDINIVLEYADAFNAWMLEKTSEPALSAYPSTDSPSVTPAGAGSETTSPVPEATGPSSEASSPAGDLSGGGVESKGKEPAPPPHEHDWQPHPNLRGKLLCSCGYMRTKEGAVKE